MAVKVRKVGYAAGAEVTGIDASKPLDPQEIAAVRQAWLDHIMIYIPGQGDLTPDQLKQFTAQFGELDLVNTRTLPQHPEHAEVVVRTNKVVALNGKEAKKSLPADKWHIDYSHSQRPATLTMLLGKQLPSIGGDTMFANSYMAYDTLSPGMRKLVDGLECVHDFTLGSGAYQQSSAEEQARYRSLKPAVIHPVAYAHPETGRKALYLGSFVRNFVGMTPEETMPLVNYLMDHNTRYEFVYRHRWTQGDLVIWDNRCSLHNAVQDYPNEVRMMWRCSLISPPVGRIADEETEKVAVAAGM